MQILYIVGILFLTFNLLTCVHSPGMSLLFCICGISVFLAGVDLGIHIQSISVLINPLEKLKLACNDPIEMWTV